MSIEALKKVFARRKNVMKKRRREVDKFQAKRPGTSYSAPKQAARSKGLAEAERPADAKPEAAVPSRPEDESENDGAFLIAFAAELEVMMMVGDPGAESDAEPGAEPGAEAEPEPAGEAGPESRAEAEADAAADAAEDTGAFRKARAELDDMRKLWRRMRKDLPQMPAVSVKKMRKEDLVANLMGVIGVGLAPLPEWGCPEGIEAYMARLMAFLAPLAAARGCTPGALEFPLGAGRWDEALVVALLVAEPPEPAALSRPPEALCGQPTALSRPPRTLSRPQTPKPESLRVVLKRPRPA